MTFQNKKIIVAGGTSGIGLAAAKLFTHAGASVTVTGRDAEKLKAAEQAGLHTTQTDSTDRAALDAFFKAHGSADHLVIALGSTKGLGNFAELSLQNLREGFEEKYWSHLNTLKAALPFLNDRGSITLITAITGSGKIPGTSGMGAVNGALEIMVPILAKELKPLRINAISPGVVDTPWWNFLSEDTKREAFAQYAAQIAAGRIANPDDIADAILFAAGNEYMTGQIIGCDGGLV